MILRTISLVAKPSRLVVALGAALLVGALMAPSAGAGGDKVVKTKGDLKMVPNALLMSTQRFSPGIVFIDSGATLTLTHDDRTADPHSLTIVNEDELPETVDEAFNCEACNETFEILPDQPGPFFVNAPGTGEGIDGRLDTLWVEEGQSVSAEVTAASGSELFFLCAIHPWMMGEIRVSGTAPPNGGGNGGGEED